MKILNLGMSYLSIKNQLKHIKSNTSNETLKIQVDEYLDLYNQITKNDTRPITGKIAKDMILLSTELVKNGMITKIDGMDLIRTLALESDGINQSYNVSIGRVAKYSKKRHMSKDFYYKSFSLNVICKWQSDLPFDQILLDYFWNEFTTEEFWFKYFFSNTLVKFVTSGILKPGGIIHLPFCYRNFKEFVTNIDLLEKYFIIHFITKDELYKNATWMSTQNIDEDIMIDVFGKEKDQEEVYCGLTRNLLNKRGRSESNVNIGTMIYLFNTIPNASNVRMIQLTNKSC